MDQPVQVASTTSIPHYYRGCKWSPDGTCLLTITSENVSKIFNIPQNLSLDNDADMGAPALEVKESNLIYDFTWFPLMNSNDPSTCFYTITSTGNPIRLIDAYTGKCSATYRAYDHLEQMKCSFSTCFSASGDKLYAGYENGYRIYRTSIPGCGSDHRTTHSKHSPGQKGILSCLSIDPVDENILAVGSYSRQIALYDERISGDANESGTGSFVMFDGHRGGITQIQFSSDGKYLFSGARKDPNILIWDTRNLKCSYLFMERVVDTNQRIQFDTNSNRENVTYLMTGNTDGNVNVWNIQNYINEYETQTSASEDDNELKQEEKMSPICTFKAGNDCINGCSLHPTLQLVATTSGQRHFPKLRKEVSDVEEDDDEYIFEEKTWNGENRIKLFWYQ